MRRRVLFKGAESFFFFFSFPFPFSVDYAEMELVEFEAKHDDAEGKVLGMES